MVIPHAEFIGRQYGLFITRKILLTLFTIRNLIDIKR